MPHHRLPFIMTAACTLAAAAAFAQTSAASQPALPTVTVPKAKVPPKVDASLADPAWQSAVTLNLTQVALGSPQGQPLVQATQVRLLWSPEFLFVRFICADSEIYTPVTGHDAKLFQGDVAEVFLDPAGDGRQYVELQVNPHNDVLDKLFLSTAEPAYTPTGVLTEEFIRREQWEFLDWNFTALRSAAAKVTLPDGQPGWVVDMAIPASDLLKRLDRRTFKAMTLRANFVRYEQFSNPKDPSGRELQSINWSPCPYGRPHRAADLWGTLLLVP